MTMKHRLKTILPLAAVAMFASASVSNAAEVVYTLTTVDSGGLGGTLTFDSDVEPTSTDDETGNKTYTHPTAALPAFSFFRDGSTAEFDQTDGVFELYLITDASFTPLFLKIDIDDTTPVGDPANGDFIFVEGDGLDLIAGTGQYQPDAIDVTGAALTAGTTTPAADLAITGIDYDAEANTVTLTWRSRPGTTYKAFASLDLSDWINELADSLGPETEGIIVDGSLLTMSFTLTDGLENEPDVFFRIQEE